MKIKLKTIILFLMLILIVVYTSTIYTIKNAVYATNEEEIQENKIYEKNKEIEEIDIKNIIDNNRNTEKQEIIIKEEEIEYTTVYIESDEIAKGDLKVVQPGKNGIKKLIIKKQYNENEENEEIIGSKVKEEATNKIVKIGTSNKYKITEIKKGENVSVTANSVELKKEPSVESEKITSITKNTMLQVKNIKDDWCMVEFNGYIGWIQKECLTNQKSIETENNNKSRKVNNSVNRNMNLACKSGLTEQEFEKILSGNSQDKNKIFEKYAKHFYYAEKQYGINGIFLAAVAIHESAFGTSKIALEKNNLFGYMAYDYNPYEDAYKFSSYEEGIDLLARVFIKYYLNAKGTKIYENQEADGRYYNGNTVDAVNKRYASDKNWANSVYNWMEYLYKRL